MPKYIQTVWYFWPSRCVRNRIWQIGNQPPDWPMLAQLHMYSCLN
jgi:hypothetical protein